MAMITYIYRKRIPTAFSIEKIFDALHTHLRQQHPALNRLELPYISSGIIAVLRNIWFLSRQRTASILHITGDVHYAALLRPFTKTIITIHDCVVLQRGTGFKRLVFWLLWYRLPLSLASAVTVVSEQTKRELLNVVSISARKLHVIPNFVHASFSFSPRAFNTERPRILHIGTTPNKNLPNVIEATRGMPCILTIVGPLDQDTTRRLQEYEIHYENHVGVDDVAMINLYREADIVCFPSTYEGFGMPIIEAQATGRVVLTSNLEPMSCVAGPGGALLVDPYAVAEIRNGFKTLTTDAALRERLIAAGLQNSRRYSIESVADAYLDVYRTIREH